METLFWIFTLLPIETSGEIADTFCPMLQARADSRVLHHMRKMPDLCTRPDFAWFIDVAGFVHEISLQAPFFPCGVTGVFSARILETKAKPQSLPLPRRFPSIG